MIDYINAFSSFAVKDLEKARTFYAEILGITVKDNDMGLIELRVNGMEPILVYPKADHEPATYTVLNFLVADLEKTVDGLIAKGLTFEQYGEPIKTDEKGICRGSGGPDIAWFKDPSGNIMAVIRDN